MVGTKMRRGRAFRIVVGITIIALIVLLAGGKSAAATSEVIVDDLSSGFTKYGTSSYWKEASIGYDNHMFYTYNGQSSVDNYAIWKPSLSSVGAGTYTVYVYIPSNYADTTNAVYTIYHNGATATRYVNQAIYSSVWVTLGDFYFSASGNEYVKLVDATGESYATKRVGFDAVKWVKKATIDSYSPSSRITVNKGESFTIKVWFTNTGNVAAYFWGGVTIWDSNGNAVFDSFGQKTYLGAGQQGSNNWTPTINTPGEYWIQFGVWNEAKTQLLDKKPVPSQNLITVVEPPDTLPPTVTGNTPTGSNVPVNTKITVTFSEAMNQASAHSAFSTSPSTTGSFSWSGNTMTYTPNSNLAYSTTYTATIGTGAKDLADNSLQSPFSWQFTTAQAPTGGTLATGLSNPNAIAVDDTHVYWTEYGSGTVKKVPKNGGTVTTLVSGLYSPTSIAVDGTFVYFGENVGDNAAKVHKVPKTGGSVITLATGLPSVSAISIDGTNVYLPDGYGGTIQKVPKSGGSVSILATGSNSPSGIAVDSNSVYWTEFTNPGTVRKVPLSGGQVTVLASNSNTPGIAVDGANVYWTESVWINNGKVNKIPVNGGSVTSLAAGLNYPWDIAVDSTYVYWIENFMNGAVKQTSTGGGTVLTLASGLAEPIAVAIDDTSVYWIERNLGGQGTGTLKKVGKGIISNNTPNTPSNPSPSDYATKQPTNPTLSWSGGDPDGDTVTYTVYLDTNSNPTTQKCSGTSTSCSVSGLSYSTTYYWKVVASDGKASPVSSNVWRFTTQAQPNNPPNQPTALNQFKSDGVTNILEGGTTGESTVIFKGTVSDPDGDNVRLEIELRNKDEPFTGEPTPETISELAASGTEVSVARYGLVTGSYKWQYRAKDSKGDVSEWREFNASGNIDFTLAPTKLQKVIQQEAKEMKVITVDGREYYIVTLKRYIDPETWEPSDYSFFAEEPPKWVVYTYPNFQPIPDKELLRKIWTVDRANILLKRIGSPESISNHIRVIDEAISASKGLSEATYIAVWGKTGIFTTLDLVFFAEIGAPIGDYGIGTIIEQQLGHYTDPTRFMLEGGRALLDASKEDYQKAREIAEAHRDGISDYTTAKGYLNHYYNGYFKFASGVEMALPTGEITKSAFWEIVNWVPEYINHLALKVTSLVNKFFIVGKLTVGVSKVTMNELTTMEKARDYINALKEIEEKTNQLFEHESYPIDYTLALVNQDKEALYEKWGIHGIDHINYNLASPGELRVFDSQGRVTGLVNGEVRMEIPNSYYFYSSRTVTIFFQNDSYTAEVVGTGEGTYGLEATSVGNGEVNTFSATDIPTTLGQTHKYTIDWTALSQGEEGVTLQIDSNGDGTFDRTIKAGSTLTDITPPVTTAVLSGTPGNNSWYISNVQVNLTATDNLNGSGVNKTEYSLDGTNWNIYTALFTITVEGITTVYFRSTDKAGNVELPKTQIIKIDRTAPSITGEATTLPNSNGWYNSDVVVHFTATDSGSGVDTVTPDITLSTEGKDQSITGTVMDKAGNSASTTVSGISIDKTAPAIAGSRNPSANANGWNNADVTVHFECSDSLSELDTCTPDNVVSTEAAGQSITGTATDKAGNSASAAVSNINIDKTSPTITGAATTLPNANGWYNSDVVVSFAGSDALSGVDTVTPDTTLSTEGKDQSVTGTIVDKAGNSASTTVSGISIDKTLPVITINSPVVKDYLHSDSVTVNFEVADVLSGIDSVTASIDSTLVTNGQIIDLTTLTLGEHTLTVQSTDKAGNSGSKSVSFYVKPVPAVVDIKPDTLNKASQSDRNAITVYIEIPGYEINAIDVSTVTLNTSNGNASAQLSPTEVGDYDSDGIPDRMVKFDRQAVIPIVDAGDKVAITIRGRVKGAIFEGSDEIRVIEHGKK